MSAHVAALNVMDEHYLTDQTRTNCIFVHFQMIVYRHCYLQIYKWLISLSFILISILRGKRSRGSSIRPKRSPTALSPPWKNYSSCCIKKAWNIIKDSFLPGHSLFELLPSGRWFRSVKTRTNRFKHSFYPTTITTLNAAN